MEKRTRVYAAAIAAGAVTGLRSMAGPAIVSRSLAAGMMGSMQQTRPHWFGTKRTAKTLAALAVGELIADKLPFMPDRTNTAPLIGRFLGGAICGAAICMANEESPWLGILAGGLAATAASFAGHKIREVAAEHGKSDMAVALMEDTVAIAGGLSALATLRA
jgi:uncharacterized membrane protein